MKLNCNYYFGLSDINSSTLIKHFYPEDLPCDWRVSYYCNEFELLIVRTADLELSAQSSSRVFAQHILEQLSKIADDIDESRLLLFDCAELSYATQQALFASQLAINATCLFINSKQIDSSSTINQHVQLEWSGVMTNKISTGQNNRDFFCHITANSLIKPAELRTIIETIQKQAIEKQAQAVYIIFSCKHALENCRNAVLLDSMMSYY